MDKVILDDNERTFALRRPQGWQPKLPRWTLHLPSHVEELAVAYIGVQNHAGAWDESATAVIIAQQIENWAQSKRDDSPVITEKFQVAAGRDQPSSLVFNCYWLSRDKCCKSVADLDIEGLLYEHAKSDKQQVGIWCEMFTPNLDRFETNYSGDDYQPGISQLKGARQLEHGLTGYWGAARDRIPASAHDDFTENGSSELDELDLTKDSKGKILKGSNSSIIAHIKSGQYWARCDDVEREAYEKDLEPHLLNGSNDIFANPTDLGDYGLRFLRNMPPGTQIAAATGRSQDGVVNQDSRDLPSPHRETCAAGFFRSLKDLESWAKNCPSHHRIYGGSVNHRRRFGSAAKMRTWHEICVLYPGEASWAYVNCLPGTGTIPFQKCTAEELR